MPEWFGGLSVRLRPGACCGFSSLSPHLSKISIKKMLMVLCVYHLVTCIYEQHVDIFSRSTKSVSSLLRWHSISFSCHTETYLTDSLVKDVCFSDVLLVSSTRSLVWFSPLRVCKRGSASLGRARPSRHLGPSRPEGVAAPRPQHRWPGFSFHTLLVVCALASGPRTFYWSA